MLQNARVTAFTFTVSKLLRENQQDGGEGGGERGESSIKTHAQFFKVW